jgi:hypothetical protein
MLEVNLTKKIKDLHNENYKTVKKEDLPEDGKTPPTTFMDCENGYTSKSNLQIQCNRSSKSQCHSSQQKKTQSFFSFFIHMCIQGLGNFSPLPPPPPLPPTPPPPSPPTPSIPNTNYFALISNFVEERV